MYWSRFLLVIVFLLIMVPFITFNQALQYDSDLLQYLGLAGLLAGVLKLSAVKWLFKGINFPWIVYLSGIIILSLNYALPFISKGLYIDTSADLDAFMESAHAVIIPGLGFLSYFAVCGLKDGRELYSRKWVPVTFLACLTGVTFVNLFSIIYVYALDIKPVYFIVTGMVAAYLSLAPVFKYSLKIKQAVIFVTAFTALIFLVEGYILVASVSFLVNILFSIRDKNRSGLLLNMAFIAASSLSLSGLLVMDLLEFCLISLVIIASFSVFYIQHPSSVILVALSTFFLLSNFGVNFYLELYLCFYLPAFVSLFRQAKNNPNYELFLDFAHLGVVVTGIVTYFNYDMK